MHVAVAALALVFALHLDVFLFERGIVPLPPLAFVLVACGISLVRLPAFPAVTRSPLWRFSLACVLLAMLGFVGPGQGDLGWAALKDVVLAFLFVTAWLLLLTRERERRGAAVAVGAALAAAVALNAYELFHPMSFSDVAGRSAGTFMNPNLSAHAILLAAAFLGAAAPSNRRLALVLGAAGAGILATFSRAGIAIWVALSAWFALGSGRLGRIGVPLAAGAALFVAFSYVPAEVLENSNVAQRLGVLHGRGFDDASASERVALLERGLERFHERPLLGHGPGQAENVAVGASVLGTHNEYLALAINYGIVGVLLWLGYLYRLLSLRALPVFLLLALAALSFHSLLLNRQTLLVLALYEATFVLRREAEA